MIKKNRKSLIKCVLRKAFTKINTTGSNVNSNNEEEFSFQPDSISRKAGKRCCPYGQDGKPLSHNIVVKYLKELNTKKLIWCSNEDCTKISTSILFKDIFKSLDFVKEIYELDERSNTKQIPNVYIKHQQVLTIEMYTKLLKGLSHRDFQLAGIIGEINISKYEFYPLKTSFYLPNNELLRKEIRKIKLDSNI